MTLYAYNISTNFILITPTCCHVSFMMSEEVYDSRVEDHKTWYCPNCGRRRIYANKSEKEKLKEQLESVRTTNQFLRKQNEKERNRTRAEKAAKTRIKNRIKNGVCPCCNRFFKNLHSHIMNQHPEYSKERGK